VYAALIVLLAAGPFAAVASEESPPVIIHNVIVDGSPAGGMAKGAVRVSSAAQRVEFHFGPYLDTSNPPVRLRYRLDGFDKEWREAGGEMRLNARFLDSANNTVSAEDFVARGESVGWAGSIARSRFDRRTEAIKAPERAVRMQIELFSGGSEQTVGVMVVDNLTVSALETNGQPETLLFRLHLAQRTVDNPSSVPAGWMRDGSKPSIARALDLGDNSQMPVLGVVDADPATWGAWRTDPGAAVAVHAGEALILSWNEMYSIGWGGLGAAVYSYLPPGQYQFQVQALTEYGEAVGSTAAWTLTVAPPFWQTSWFRGSLLASLVAGLVAAVRYQTWRKMQVQLEALDQQRALALERTRIARDIHDDLGANLTQIALLSELAQTDLEQPALAKAHLAQIFTTAGAVARQLDEIVWAISPANDTLEQFAGYMCKFAQDYLRVAGIRCRLEVPESLPNYSMSSAERHDMFLAAKEALHNVVKHARAGEVWVRLKVDEGSLILVIEDNGTGLRNGAASGARGNGLLNMRNRMQQHAGGTFTQSSETGHGAVVRLALPLKAGGGGRVGSTADL